VRKYRHPVLTDAHLSGWKASIRRSALTSVATWSSATGRRSTSTCSSPLPRRCNCPGW